ncbi:MAG: PTS IIA-like nitrogen-regulatory protein PtsN [Moraxellaceae bacterium]|nr:MAG: PTS IIA-like nitrogen-regulatory protein PtsN [Moraxellaceae bacterium]
MQVSEIITPERTCIGLEGSSKKRVLEQAAEFIAQQSPELDPNVLFDNLINREKLGSTAIGKGVAIPHCRINHCNRVLGTLIRLNNAVDFDAIDNEPVDLLFVLLVPESATDEHLQALSQIASRFNNDELTSSLRSAEGHQSLYDCFVAS